MRFNGAFLRRPIVKHVDYIDVQDALRGSTAEQKDAAVRVCAGLLGIDETAALKVDPDVALPAFWTLLQYRGLTQSEKTGAAPDRRDRFDRRSATRPTRRPASLGRSPGDAPPAQPSSDPTSTGHPSRHQASSERNLAPSSPPPLSLCRPCEVPRQDGPARILEIKYFRHRSAPGSCSDLQPAKPRISPPGADRHEV